MRRALTLFLLFLAVAAGACSSGDRQTGKADATAATSSPTIEATPTTTTGAGVAVRVYFARHEKVATAGRTITAPAATRDILDQLLAGPDSFETDIGMSTEVPDGTEVLDATIDDGAATVDLSAEFASGGGSLSMQLRVAQVVFTLTQLENVDAVNILIDGEEVDGIGGEGIPAADLSRADFQNVTPLILVESPVPGEAVSSPLEVNGISNTFEANVRYSITDPAGLILRDGFTTATAGNGAWGTFRFAEAFDGHRSGLGTVIVWQDDADTGEQRDVYEVPVRMD